MASAPPRMIIVHVDLQRGPVEVARDRRTRVTSGRTDLRLREVERVGQTRATQVCSAEVRAQHVGTFEARPTEIRTEQQRTAQAGAAQVRPTQIATGQVAIGEVDGVVARPCQPARLAEEGIGKGPERVDVHVEDPVGRRSRRLLHQPGRRGEVRCEGL